MHKLLLPLIAMALLGVAGCCKCKDPRNPDCENYDPCIDIAQPNADFGISMLLGYDNASNAVIYPVFDQDTLHYGRDMRFSAAYKNAKSYKWKVGADPLIRTDSAFTLYFDAPFGRVDITLMVEFDVNSDCYTNRTGYDTVTKTLYFVRGQQMPQLGKYRGYNTGNPGNVFDIEITYEYIPIPGSPCGLCDTTFHLKNLPQGCTYMTAIRLASVYGRLFIDRTIPGFTPCNEPKAEFRFSKDYKEIEIEYTLRDPSNLGGQYIHKYLYKGTKI